MQMVRDRGYLRCRPDPDEISLGHGFSSDVVSVQREWQASCDQVLLTALISLSMSDIVQCKAIAAAILGDPERVEFTLMPFKDQFRAVANGTSYPQVFVNGQHLGGSEDLEAWLAEGNRAAA